MSFRDDQMYERMNYVRKVQINSDSTKCFFDFQETEKFTHLIKNVKWMILEVTRN